MRHRNHWFLVIGGGLFALLLIQHLPILSSAAPKLLVQAVSLQPDQAFSANQLDDLVAPIALYPDPLLSQVLVATTYPLELVEASQWLQRNTGLTGDSLTNAAAKQNWDPSIQALVLFPDVVKRLIEDITWTTNMGNAFLAQQSDVMDAVQRMRMKARQAGKLESNSQQTVNTVTVSGGSLVYIVPARPDVIYVPVYDPVWIWGVHIHFPYPRWPYPPRPRVGVVIIYNPPIIIKNYLGGGWVGWDGWGWTPDWPRHTVIVNNVFIRNYNFNLVRPGAPARPVPGASTIWSHDGFHRLGVPYPNRKLTDQYRPGVRDNLRPRESGGGGAPTRPAPGPAPAPRERIGNREMPANPPGRNRGAFGGIEDGNTSRQHTDRGHSSLGPDRSKPAPRPQSGGGGQKKGR